MTPTVLKGIGIGCFVACAILLFVAWERYHDNANQVDAANNMLNSSPLGGMMGQMPGGAKLEAATPEATKYALFFAALTAIGGVVCFVMSPKMGPAKPSQRTPPPIP